MGRFAFVKKILSLNLRHRGVKRFCTQVVCKLNNVRLYFNSLRLKLALLHFNVRAYVPFWNMHVRPSMLICQPICPTK